MMNIENFCIVLHISTNIKAFGPLVIIKRIRERVKSAPALGSKREKTLRNLNLITKTYDGDNFEPKTLKCFILTRNTKN